MIKDETSIILTRIQELKKETSKCGGYLILGDNEFIYYFTTINLRITSEDIYKLLVHVVRYIEENRINNYPKEYSGEKKEIYGNKPKRIYKLIKHSRRCKKIKA